MADQKYSQLTLYAPAQNDTFAVNDTSASGGAGSSMAVTVSSVVASGVSTGVLFFNQFAAGDPASTAVNNLRVMGRDVAGQMRLVTVGEYGDWRPMQRSLFNDSAFLWTNNSSAVGYQWGGISSTQGTFSSAAPVVGSAWTTKRRTSYSTTSAGVSTNVCGWNSINNDYFMGSTSGYGGFFFFARVGLESYSSASRAFVGMTPAAANTICSSEPSSMIQSLGFAINIAESQWSFKHSSNGTASSEPIPGQTTLGNANSTAKLGYDFYIFHPPINTTIVYYRMDELNVGGGGSTLVNSNVTLHIPHATTFMKAAVMMGSSSVSIKPSIVKVYIETTN